MIAENLLPAVVHNLCVKSMRRGQSGNWAGAVRPLDNPFSANLQYQFNIAEKPLKANSLFLGIELNIIGFNKLVKMPAALFPQTEKLLELSSEIKTARTKKTCEKRINAQKRVILELWR